MEWKEYQLNDGRSIQLRPIKPEDKIGLISFTTSMEGTDRLTPVDIVNIFTYPYYYINMVIIHDESVVGYGEIKKSPDLRDGELKIHISSEYQGAGLGTAMLIMLVHEASEEKLHSINLRVDSANTRAIHLFRKNGFTEENITKEVINGNQRETLYMVRTLTR
jgi:RimJ/RimL family protein N-acetyltransferase